MSIGESKNYHVPDLTGIGLGVGIKSVEYGKFPVIFKKSSKPEIIILKQSYLNFLICGYASQDVLKKYQSDSLILSPILIHLRSHTYLCLQIDPLSEKVFPLHVL